MTSTRTAFRWLVAFACALPVSSGCLCISPSSLLGFACEADGHCGLEGFTCCADQVCRRDCTEATDGGGRGDAGPTDGGAADCSSSTCEGCCDGPICRTGLAEGACGTTGSSCTVCDPVVQRCVGGVCQTALGIGSACTASHACVSGFCADGRCCDRPCQGACETCAAAGSEGRCVPRLEGTLEPACAPFACDGVGSACPTGCETVHQCVSGHYCDTDAGQCLSERANGQQCATATECVSGFCADQVCCDGACSGSCDRCDLAGLLGQCSTVDAGDPGVPSCAPYVCNGAVPDCPITCGSGCPTGTFCSGTYCSAKRTLGLPCGGAAECSSGLCRDGVCCDSACDGKCQACSVAAGAPANGSCTMLSAAKVCRPAAGLCDVEERCIGGSACPVDGFGADGAACGTTQFGTWSVCDYGGVPCSIVGSRSRDRYDQVCHTGVCAQDTSTDTSSNGCLRDPEGATCGAATLGTWGACSFAGVCAQSGTRTRDNVALVCQDGGCAQVTAVESDSSGCARPTDGKSCAPSTFGVWSACSAPSIDNACLGSWDRVRTDWACDAGACGSSTAGETQPCPLAEGEQCASCYCDSDTCQSTCSWCAGGACVQGPNGDCNAC